MAQLVRGITLRVESGLTDIFLDNILDGAVGDALAESRDKHRVAVTRNRLDAVGEVVAYGGNTAPFR